MATGSPERPATPRDPAISEAVAIVRALAARPAPHVDFRCRLCGMLDYCARDCPYRRAVEWTKKHPEERG